MVFRKKFSFKKAVSRVVVYATAMGVYRLDVNGIKAGDRYFAPGFTSYKHTLQYQTYDASADINNNVWRSATIERLKINPEIIAETGSTVRAHEVFSPISCTKRADGELIYDFGQNFAGVIRA